MNTKELVRLRRSVRSFEPGEIEADVLEDLLDHARAARNPYGLPITWKILHAKTDGVASPVITGTGTWIAGKMKKVPHAEEAFGCAFEQFVLYAVSRGIGTTWIAGTMNRPVFEKAMRLEADEVMPCVSPLGYPAEKMSLRESLMRKGVKADSRLPFEELFFEGDFQHPLTPETAGEFAEVLEMVRWAPSAVNRQPWRIVLRGDSAYFYEFRTKGYVSADGWDTQKIDMGIALCHFEAGMKDLGYTLEFVTEDPGLEVPEAVFPIAGYRFFKKAK